MRVGIIGDFSENNDEGLKNVAKQIFGGLSRQKDLEVIKLNVRGRALITLIPEIRRTKPDIIHYIPGPTNMSISLLKLLNLLMDKNTRFVVSATHPMYNFSFFKKVGFKPDLYISSSLSHLKKVKTLNIKTLYLPNGVDIDKFHPVSQQQKAALRKKYGLKEDVYTLLHVGHLIPNRNLDGIKELAKNNQVVIVASNYISKDERIYNELRESGCSIFEGYYPNIEEFYQCADCYIFPVVPGNSIDCPLSILEAMACNLPVITTKFEGLSCFESNNLDIMFVENTGELESIVDITRDTYRKRATREQVLNLSWDNIVMKIVKEYEDLVNSGASLC
jgi:glycosyltransferase involved in cell wall biosynthesis